MRTSPPLCALAITVSASAAIPTSEREALVALYQSTNGNAWTDKTNWLGAAGDGMHVVRRQLRRARAHVEHTRRSIDNLDGTLSVRSAQAHRDPLRCSCPTNNLRGSLPSQFSELSQIEGIFFPSHPLTGTLPGSWGALEKLREIGLDGNELTGALPVQLGDMSALEKLTLSENAIHRSRSRKSSGTSPTSRSCSSASRAHRIDPEGARLAPKLGVFRSRRQQSHRIRSRRSWEISPPIVELDLKRDSLTGGIPAALGKLKTLETPQAGQQPTRRHDPERARRSRSDSLFFSPPMRSSVARSPRRSGRSIRLKSCSSPITR